MLIRVTYHNLATEDIECDHMQPMQWSDGQASPLVFWDTPEEEGNAPFRVILPNYLIGWELFSDEDEVETPPEKTELMPGLLYEKLR